MPDPTPNTPTTPPNVTSGGPAPAKQRGPTIRIGDEFGTAKRNLPPAKIVLFAIAGVLIVFGVVAFFQRARPQGGGSLDNVAAVDLPGQNACMVAITFTLRNSGEKPLWVHNVQSKLVAASGEMTADAVSAIDLDRYYQAFPALKAGAQPALSPEDKLLPGQQVQRTVIVSFPVTVDAFNQRRSLSVIVQPYDQPVPVTLTKSS
jgi:hypothetical protein